MHVRTYLYGFVLVPNVCVSVWGMLQIPHLTRRNTRGFCRVLCGHVQYSSKPNSIYSTQPTELWQMKGYRMWNRYRTFDVATALG